MSDVLAYSLVLPAYEVFLNNTSLPSGNSLEAYRAERKQVQVRHSGR